jgi:RNA polymerase sigma-70 factor (ECF subfamily)
MSTQIDRQSNQAMVAARVVDVDQVAQETRSPYTAEEFAEVYREHHATVVAYVTRWVGPATATDVAQEVFAELWTGHARFDPSRGSVRALLFSIAYHRSVDVIRHDGRRSQREDLHGHIGFWQHPTDFELLREEQSTRVIAALAQLAPILREPITLAIYGERTYGEVAVELGLPEGTVKSRIRAGLGQLRVLLADRQHVTLND